MRNNREELDAELDRLQDGLPQLESDEDATFDYLDFQQKAQAIVEAAGVEDRGYFRARVNCILASAGLVPSESEGEECPPLSGRVALDAALDALDEAIPHLQRDYGDDFWSAFAGQADVIEDNAGVRSDYVASRIEAMLTRHGLTSP